MLINNSFLLPQQDVLFLCEVYLIAKKQNSYFLYKWQHNGFS
jgi:hypothetical protein